MQWQGFVRHLSRFYKTTVVYGRKSSEYFYRDFASEFHAVEIDSWDTDFYEVYRFDYQKWAEPFQSCDLLLANNDCHALRDTFNQEFIKFGRPSLGRSYDVVIHARAIPNLEGNKAKSSRNWPTGHWDELCRSLKGFKIAAVGIPELSYLPEGVVDLRGIDTESLCSVLASSRACVGPSSGVMHLATLCGTPHVVWTSRDFTWGFGGTAYRYTRSWNPFATPAVVLTEMGIMPSAEYVRENIIKILEITRWSPRRRPLRLPHSLIPKYRA